MAKADKKAGGGRQCKQNPAYSIHVKSEKFHSSDIDKKMRFSGCFTVYYYRIICSIFPCTGNAQIYVEMKLLLTLRAVFVIFQSSITFSDSSDMKLYDNRFIQFYPNPVNNAISHHVYVKYHFTRVQPF